MTTTLVSQDKYIHAGKIFDSSSGEYQLNKTIIISGNIISSIEDGFIEPKNENIAVYDLKSKVLLPGLIDFHVHMESESGGKERYINRFQDNKADVAFKSTVVAKKTLVSRLYNGTRCRRVRSKYLTKKCNKQWSCCWTSHIYFWKNNCYYRWSW